jgi:RNA polymerase sigma-70 factor (ECF subfamily)
VPAATPTLVDLESREWLRDLRADGVTAEEAVTRLHALLLRAARFEVARQRAAMPHVRVDTDAVAMEAADDALVRIRASLDDFRGDSRFTTWAYKFALLEAAVQLRRRAWQGRELPTTPAGMSLLADIGLAPEVPLEQGELLDALREGIACLTPHQRDVLVALAVNGVPIDVLAERLASTRDALYETLHDARVNLRRHLAAADLAFRST